jgi:hypothetical protein
VASPREQAAVQTADAASADDRNAHGFGAYPRRCPRYGLSSG